MKTLALSIALTAIALAGSLMGCAGPKDDADLSTPQAKVEGSDPQAGAPKGASLGSQIANEHFAVTLTAEPSELKVGRAKFIAKVLHHGEPTAGASVKLKLSMPEMGMGGPDVTLKHTKGGSYEGEAELSMGGNWEAKVSVEQEGHPGEATYRFVVMQ